MITRRKFMESATALAGMGLAGGSGLRALAQDPEAQVERAANHMGYEVAPWKVRPFSLRQVKLLHGPLREAQERTRVYLYMLPNERLLHSFRLTAGITSTAAPLGGWEAPAGELRGHFAGGHYLSACALMVTATGDEPLRQKANALVEELAACQRADGYLGAYPASFYDRLRAHQRVWAPFYTFHKIMAGLLDMYVYCGNMQALNVCVGMADWVGKWVEPIAPEEWAEIQTVEHGGMNEVLFNLYGVTGEKRFLELGFRFEHKAFFDPLAANSDKLAGHHSNTNIPKVIGAARGFELSGNARYRNIAENFWQMVANHHAYCTGGTSATVPMSKNDAEGWHKADDLSNQLVPDAQECCCSYNMMKLTRHLFGWTADARYMDYYERLLWNLRMGTQDEHGMLMYYVSTAPGYWKTFGTPFDTFWCCTGTGVEEFAKLADSIYFHDERGIYVNQFAASELDWHERGVRLTQLTDFPEQESTELIVQAVHPVRLAIRVRTPYWCVGAKVRVNGIAEQPKTLGNGYVELERTWQSEDRIQIALPMHFHAANLPGNPAARAMMYGPLVLAALMGREGLTTEMMYGAASSARNGMLSDAVLPRIQDGNGEWVEKTGEPLGFKTAGQLETMELRPLYQVLHDRYSIYFQVGAKV